MGVQTPAAPEERYLFGIWLRRVLNQRKMRVREFRETMGVPSNKLNRWLTDHEGVGRPEVPDEEDAKMIAAVLGVREEVVLRLAERVRAALEG